MKTSTQPTLSRFVLVQSIDGGCLQKFRDRQLTRRVKQSVIGRNIVQCVILFGVEVYRDSSFVE